MQVNDKKKHPYAGRRGILRRYFETTTIKGVPKFMKSTSRCLKMMWILVVLIGLSISIYLLIRLLKLYISHSTVTSVEEYKESNRDEAMLPFPDITVCNLNSIATHASDSPAYKTYLDNFKAFTKDLTNMRKDYEHTATDIKMELSHMSDTFGFFQSYRLKDEEASERIHNLFISCMAAGRTWDDCSGEEYISVWMFDGSLGPCFTINMTAVSKGGYAWIKGITAIFHLNERGNFTVDVGRYDPSLKETHAAGIVLMVHTPNSAPNVLDYINLSPGTHSTVHLEPVIKRRLPDPYSDCAMEQTNMHQNELYGHYLEENMEYSFSHCDEICFQIQLTESCGCIMADAFHTRKMQDAFPYCGNIYRYNDMYELIDTLNCTHYWMYSGGYDRQKCDCHQQCHETEYYIKSSSTPWPHSSYEFIFFNEYVTNSETFINAEEYKNIDINSAEGRKFMSENFLQVHILFERKRLIKFIDKQALDLPTVIGSLGGILNLWIGISFVTIFEVVELIYYLLRYRSS